MKKYAVMLGLFSLSALAVSAPMKPKDLAKETADMIVSMESMLQGSIRSGDKADFYRFVEKPVVDQMHKWPPVGTNGYDDYARCYFALDAFRVYAGDQFNASGKLPKSSPTYKDYIGQKKQCFAKIKY